MSDQQITCSECGDVFPFTEAEAAFYESKGLASPPKRCKACRQARKASGGGGRGAPDSRGPRFGVGGGAGGNRSGGASDSRGPGGGNDRPFSRGRGPGDGRGAGGDRFSGGGGARGAGRGGTGGGSGGGFRPPSRDGAAGGGGFAGGGARAPRGNGEYRSPAFPEQRWEPRRNDARARPASAPNDLPPRARDSEGPREPRASQPRAEKAERPERPRFDITCGQCGVAAQVPFKPIEGRQVFCQECYRARRGIAKESVDAVELSDTDTGIVE